jgi:hypothetical protein
VAIEKARPEELFRTSLSDNIFRTNHPVHTKQRGAGAKTASVNPFCRTICTVPCARWILDTLTDATQCRSDSLYMASKTVTEFSFYR